MTIIETAIPDVKLIKPRVFKDERGYFLQSYHEQQYRDAGIDVTFVQDNRSQSTQGTLRGVHYQLKHAQDKLVSVTRGSVFDVAVDVRKGSPTFGQWVGEILSEDNQWQLFIPKGFAHGFVVLSAVADFSYKCSDFYAPGDEYGIIWNDPEIGIDWSFDGTPILSEKDLVLPPLCSAVVFD